MEQAQVVRDAFTGVEVNDEFTEAIVRLRDGSGLRFRHRVDERTIRAVHPKRGQVPQILGEQSEAPATVGSQSQFPESPPLEAASQAETILGAITRFRLNAKHLEITLADGSRWEISFGRRGGTGGRCD